MAVSQGTASGLPGMSLKAWAYIKANGTLLKSFNVTSVNKTGAGAYSIVFAGALPNAEYMALFHPVEKGSALFELTARTVNGANLITTSTAGSGTDFSGLWEFYG